MIVRRVGVLSIAKISGVLYAILGFIFGLIFAFVGMILGTVESDSGAPPGMFGALFGAFSIILLPIFYGVLGFVGAAISAALYNLLAGRIGGIELEFEDSRAARPQANAPGAQGV